jgi:hypothetical protein
MSNNKEKTLSFEDLVSFIWKWRKQLAIVGLVTIILASIFSSPFFIKPKYKSTVIFYPTTTNSISRAILPEVGQRAQDALEFGAEEEAEKALQILQSSKLRDRLVIQFNLLNHYRINPEKERYPYTKLEKKLDGNIKVSRTRYLSIKIDVLDESPEMAAKIATGIANLYDTIKSEINLERAISALEIVERAHKSKEEMINGLHTQMQEIGRKGVINYEEQAKSIQEALILAGGGSLSGNSGTGAKKGAKAIEELMEQQNKLVEFGGLYLSIVDKIKLEEEKLSDIKAKLDRARIDVEEVMSHQFRVSDATPAEKKSYPVRWLIVVVSLFSSIIVATLVLALYQNMVLGKNKTKKSK